MSDEQIVKASEPAADSAGENENSSSLFPDNPPVEEQKPAELGSSVLLRQAAERGLAEFLRRKEERGPRICMVDGCSEPYLARGWCSYHYEQWYKYKNIKEIDYKLDEEYYCKPPDNNGSVCEIQIGGYTSKSKHIGVALLEPNDYERISQYKWSAKPEKNGKNVYAVRFITGSNGKQRMISMHREVFEAKKSDPLIDHKNNDTLDNCRCNLRFATPSQNSHNRKSVGKRYSYNPGRTLPWRAELWFPSETEAREAVEKNRRENIDKVFS